MSRFTSHCAALLLAAGLLLPFAGCSEDIPVATEAQGMEGMQNMDSGAEAAPR